MSASVPDPESTAHEAYPEREYNEAPAPAKSAEEAIRKDGPQPDRDNDEDPPDNNPIERDSSKEGPWRPGDSIENGGENGS